VPDSVQPAWCSELPMQQQSVLLLAARGPDGIGKFHPCKQVVRAYRAFVLKAARHGQRELKVGERGDTFMGLEVFAVPFSWTHAVADYFDHVDELPHHYHLHLMHGAEILGYHHPDLDVRVRWFNFYKDCCHNMHLPIESREALKNRLNDKPEELHGNS